MALERAFLKQVMLSGFDKEASYNAGPAGWTAGSAFSLMDYEDTSAYEQWDDTVVGDADLVTGHELPTRQIIARQSMRLTYSEPRTKPNTLAAMLGLVLGNVVSSTQDGVNTAWRHRIEPGSNIALPSIGIQTLRDNGVQRKYHGIKGDQITLSTNGPFLQCAGQLIGSGHRATAADAFVASIPESWLLWGDVTLLLKATGGTPINTTLATPSQVAANLGGSEVNVSTRVRTWSLTWNNALSAEAGYRASTGLVRGNFHAPRRTGTVALVLDVDSATEATELGYYLTQAPLAMELRLNSGVAIDTGTFFFGLTVIIPQVQLTPIIRGQTEQLENITLNGTIMDDDTNPGLLAFVYNAQAAYLA